MDVLLTVEQPTNTRNAFNEDETTWATYVQMFGARVWNKSGENFEGKQEVSSDNVTFNCRYNSGVNTTMRFKQANESTYFYIRNVRSSRREGLTILDAIRRDNQ